MPSPRRIRLLTLAAVATCVMFFYYTSLSPGRDLRESRTIENFYHKTINAIDGARTLGQPVVNTETGAKAGHIPADRDADGDVDEDDRQMAQQMTDRLKAAEQKAKDKANEKAARPDPPSKVIGVGSSREGQVKAEVDEDVKGSVQTKKGKKEGSNQVQEPVKAPGEKEAEETLDSIMKRSPVIIFSKSYCPYSKRAKGLLLEKYNINPDPYVVELDKHPIGAQLQAELEQKTGRRTVPNILINGVSIGGSDEVVELDKGGKLIEKFQLYGKKHVVVTERFVSGPRHS